MHRKHFFVPATGAPAGDYELYLLGLDWLPEAIQPCCASGECGTSACESSPRPHQLSSLHGFLLGYHRWYMYFRDGKCAHVSSELHDTSLSNHLLR